MTPALRLRRIGPIDGATGVWGGKMRRRRPSWVHPFAVLLLAGALVACGGDDDGGDGEATETTEETDTTSDAGSEDEQATETTETDGGDDDGGGGGGECLSETEIGEIVGFEVTEDEGSTSGSCAYTSSDPENIGGSIGYSVADAGGTTDTALDLAKETLEGIFEGGAAEDADIGDGGFFFDAGIVVQLIFVEDDDLYTLVIGGLEVENGEEVLTELAEAIR